ncbi:MAG: hypothetical protein FJZ98_08205 [Chloroflexi bacterium]|nr:hypothetical protein [Chloroflexota bacterium]
MNDVFFSESINQKYPAAHIGIMILELKPWKESLGDLSRMTDEIIFELKKTNPDKDTLKYNNVIEAYALYYKGFKKTFHLIPQLESVIFHDKKNKAPFPLLQAVFAAELKNMLLTAVHDVDAVQFPVSVGLASGEEKYQLLNGSETITKSGDMCMSDRSGVISSIIYGPDNRTKLTPQTSKAMIVVYAPVGIGLERVDRHFDDLISLIELITEESKVKLRRIFPER